MIDVTNLKKVREQRQRQTTHTGEMPHDDASSVILLTDGGDEAENNENDRTEDNESDGTENTTEDNGTESDGETQVLYLDLEGLFLDLLGLEVDLNEVILDVSAVRGSGNLLGNLLSEVAGLLDTDLSDILDGILPDDILSGVLPDELLSEMDLDDRIPSLSDVMFGVVNLLLDMVLDALEDGESTDESSSDTQ
ncbi:hypothetical protein [Halocatena marina]|uniref:hypothetical protein n=1 Tax=Halocatena marina TaxID=2934937 RepID=UPI00200C21AD|nr:hypothetical protein [Halocatena marina]